MMDTKHPSDILAVLLFYNKLRNQELCTNSRLTFRAPSV